MRVKERRNMSKQSEAKDKQGYTARALLPVCANCSSFRMDIVNHDAILSMEPYPVETNLRCSIGGFAVRKMGTCNEWSPKV